MAGPNDSMLFPRPPIPQYHVDLPVGGVLAFAGQVVSTSKNPGEHDTVIEALGLMECDGRELNITEYPELFAVLGYKFGGEGINFKIPDYRGKAPIEGVTYIIKFSYSNI